MLRLHLSATGLNIMSKMIIVNVCCKSIVLSLVLIIGATWILAFMAPVPESSWEVSEGHDPAYGSWYVERADTFGATTIQFFRWTDESQASFGCTSHRQRLTGSAQRFTESTARFEQRTDGTEKVFIRSFGFPFRGMRYEYTAYLGDGTIGFDVKGGIIVGPDSKFSPLALPYHLSFPAFVLNGLVYSSIVFFALGSYELTRSRRVSTPKKLG
jgi:hypothetical protein